MSDYIASFGRDVLYDEHRIEPRFVVSCGWPAAVIHIRDCRAAR